MSSLAFGGGLLAGEKLVRFVYIDETGLANPVQERWLVVPGVIVHADSQLSLIENHLDSLVKKWIPEAHWGDFVFHATELFNGGGKVFRRDDPEWTLEKRLLVADDLALIPSKFNLPLTFGWVDRSVFPETLPEEEKQKLTPHQKQVGAHTVAYVRCAMDIELWMRKNAPDEVCLLIVEDNQDARRHIREAQRFHQDSERLLSDEEKKFFPLRRIKEDPLFQEKRRYSPLQIADFCAYVFKRYLKDRNDEKYLRFLDPMRGQIALA